MREIKFRCWFESLEKMKYSDFDEGRDCINNTLEIFNKKQKLMQYTGLKDKLNQNEVYEHDIINHVQFGFLKVEWDYRDTGWICLSKNYRKYRLSEVLLLGGIRVGNIYENKELLDAR